MRRALPILRVHAPCALLVALGGCFVEPVDAENVALVRVALSAAPAATPGQFAGECARDEEASLLDLAGCAQYVRLEVQDGLGGARLALAEAAVPLSGAPADGLTLEVEVPAGAGLAVLVLGYRDGAAWLPPDPVTVDLAPGDVADLTVELEPAPTAVIEGVFAGAATVAAVAPIDVDAGLLLPPCQLTPGPNGGTDFACPGLATDRRFRFRALDAGGQAVAEGPPEGVVAGSDNARVELAPDAH